MCTLRLPCLCSYVLHIHVDFICVFSLRTTACLRSRSSPSLTGWDACPRSVTTSSSSAHTDVRTVPDPSGSTPECECSSACSRITAVCLVRSVCVRGRESRGAGWSPALGFGSATLHVTVPHLQPIRFSFVKLKDTVHFQNENRSSTGLFIWILCYRVLHRTFKGSPKSLRLFCPKAFSV